MAALMAALMVEWMVEKTVFVTVVCWAEQKVASKGKKLAV